MNEYGALLEWYWQGTRSSCRKTCPSATLSTINPTYTCLELRLATWAIAWSLHTTEWRRRRRRRRRRQQQQQQQQQQQENSATDVRLIYKGMIITAQTLFQSPQMSTKQRFLQQCNVCIWDMRPAVLFYTAFLTNDQKRIISDSP